MAAMPAPEIITRYLHAADVRDAAGCAACFTERATVMDEGKTYTGREEIFRWREHGVGQFQYTTTVTGAEPVSSTEYRVTVRVEGDFPGGLAHLTYDFTLHDDLIDTLRIVE